MRVFGSQTLSVYRIPGGLFVSINKFGNFSFNFWEDPSPLNQRQVHRSKNRPKRSVLFIPSVPLTFALAAQVRLSAQEARWPARLSACSGHQGPSHDFQVFLLPSLQALS